MNPSVHHDTMEMIHGSSDTFKKNACLCFRGIYRYLILVGAGDNGILKLGHQCEALIQGISDGSWKHLPKTSVLRKKLRSLKLSDWKFKRNDFDDDKSFREYDVVVKALWPTKDTLKSVLLGLREKVRS